MLNLALEANRFIGLPGCLPRAADQLLSGCGAMERAEIAACFESGVAYAGEVLIAQGQAAKCPLLFIVAGRIALKRVASHFGPTTIERRQAPALAGESDVLAMRPPLLGAVAESQVSYMRLSNAALEGLIARRRPAAARLLEALAAHLAQTPMPAPQALPPRQRFRAPRCALGPRNPIDASG